MQGRQLCLEPPLSPHKKVFCLSIKGLNMLVAHEPNLCPRQLVLSSAIHSPECPRHRSIPWVVLPVGLTGQASLSGERTSWAVGDFPAREGRT